MSNELDELLLTLSYSGMKCWHRCLSLLKRNTDATKACTVVLSLHLFTDIVSKKYYYFGIKELVERSLLLATNDKNVFIVNIKHANKLYKPKLDI